MGTDREALRLEASGQAVIEEVESGAQRELLEDGRHEESGERVADELLTGEPVLMFVYVVAITPDRRVLAIRESPAVPIALVFREEDDLAVGFRAQMLEGHQAVLRERAGTTYCIGPSSSQLGQRPANS